jgi:hypothetical protein
LEAGMMENLPQSHPERSSHYKLKNIKIPEGTTYPVDVSQINKYEKLNTVAINVYYVENDSILPLRISKLNNTGVKEIDMLLLVEEKPLVEDGEVYEDNTRKHFILIKNFNRLFSSQVNKSHTAKFYCKTCLNHFETEELLIKHIPACIKITNGDGCLTELPQDTTLYFENHTRSVPIPFVIYADFESTINPDSKQHIANSWAYKIVCCLDNTLSKEIVLEHSSAKTFLESAMKETEDIMAYYESLRSSPIELSKYEVSEYCKTWSCVYCECDLITRKDFEANMEESLRIGLTKANIKVRDHCHITGKFRGASCNSCNLKARTPRNVPIFFHNLNYDSHLIIKELEDETAKIDCIPNTEENYISFSVNKCKFVDSYRFLSSSLDKLVEALYEKGAGIHKFVQTKSLCPDDDEGLKLLMRKIPYPYEFMSEEKMDLPVDLNPEDFHDTLNAKDISKADYAHFKKIVKHFKFQH